MYLTAVKTVLDRAIAVYTKATGMSPEQVCKQMGAHLDQMAKEHREDDPQIPYEEPICRLGYIYKHLAANATLAERSIANLSMPRAIVEQRAGQTLRVCAVGGGPGSEMLGLAKFFARYPLSHKNILPARIDLVVLDRFAQWGETWNMLATEAERILATAAAAAGVAGPAIAPSFYPMDVCAPASYSTYAWLFAQVDLVIFDYVISENLERLPELADAIRIIVQGASDHAAFVFIDRKEHSDRINAWILGLLGSVGLGSVDGPMMENGTLDRDERVDSDLGDYPKAIGHHPRVKFFTSFYRNPTAFYMATQKGPRP